MLSQQLNLTIIRIVVKKLHHALVTGVGAIVIPVWHVSLIYKSFGLITQLVRPRHLSYTYLVKYSDMSHVSFAAYTHRSPLRTGKPQPGGSTIDVSTPAAHVKVKLSKKHPTPGTRRTRKSSLHPVQGTSLFVRLRLGEFVGDIDSVCTKDTDCDAEAEEDCDSRTKSDCDRDNEDDCDLLCE